MLLAEMKAGRLGILACEIIAHRTAAPIPFRPAEIAAATEPAGQLARGILERVDESVERALLGPVEGPVFSVLASAGAEVVARLLGWPPATDPATDETAAHPSEAGQLSHRKRRS
ncbi:MAG TPA: hypothetical protein VHW44_00610 [Pseudonocardiaceae bacterium]|nr:hypothetical protein [Pseudonocardiaceae bacterium]